MGFFDRIFGKKKKTNNNNANNNKQGTGPNIKNTSDTGNKECPNCGKVIKKQAIRCKYCNYYFKEGKVMPKTSNKSKNPPNNKPKTNAPSSSNKATWTVIDEYAHCHTSIFEESDEEKELKKDLLSRGPEIVDIIVDYLIKCGLGHPSIESYWWSNAKGLVRIIKEFPDTDYETQYKRLISLNSNIWEYQTEIKEVAQEELRLLKEKIYSENDITYSDEDKEIIKNLDALDEIEEKYFSDEDKDVEEGELEKTDENEAGVLSQLLDNSDSSFCMEVSNKYSFGKRIFFEGEIEQGRINFGDIVYIYGKNGKLKYENIRVLLIHDNRGLETTSLSASESKYAALILAGLYDYGDLEYGDIISTKELDLEVVEEEATETKELPIPKTYNHKDYRTHVKMATDDLREICGANALQSKVDWVKNVGQDLYDAHGFTAMQEVFINVKTTHPQCQLALSAIWDGVGGWAD